VSLDHVLVAVRNLDEAAHDFEKRYELSSIPGGRHPGIGTANRIIPLGRSYIELIAVVDQAEALSSARSMRVARAVSLGRTFATWAVRTNHLDDLRVHLASRGLVLPETAQGSRARPDGTMLRWRSQELRWRSHESIADDDVLPFVIEWEGPANLHPGRVPAAHRSGASAIRHVVLGDPDPAAAASRLELVLGRGAQGARRAHFAAPGARRAHLGVSREVRASSWSGVLAIVVATSSGDLVIS
jgi:hypothetical protein